MKPILILFLLSIITLNHCESNVPIVGKKEKTKAQKNEDTIWGYCWFGSLLTPPQTEYRVVDNNDGTVSLNKVDITGTNLCIIPGLGKKEKFTTQYYIKKCIQGQVYRQAQNDCKGTGTAANYYGAQKFQWCAAGSGCDTPNIPALISCKNDNFNNIVWSLGNVFMFSDAIYTSVSSSYLQRSEEIPTMQTEFYWSGGGSGAYSYNMRGTYNKIQTDQTQFFYILCSKGA